MKDAKQKDQILLAKRGKAIVLVHKVSGQKYMTSINYLVRLLKYRMKFIYCDLIKPKKKTA